MKNLIASLIEQANELHARGAIRPDHDQRWSMLRQDLERAAAEADQLDAAPPAIDRAAAGAAVDQLRAGLAELVGRVETLAMAVDTTGDAVRELVAKSDQAAA